MKNLSTLLTFLFLTVALLTNVQTAKAISEGDWFQITRAFVYFDNTNTSWSAVSIYLGRQWNYATAAKACGCDAMTTIANTKWYYREYNTPDDYNNSHYTTMIFTDVNWGWQDDKTVSYQAQYITNYTNTCQTDMKDGTTHIFTPASGEKECDVSHRSAATNYDTNFNRQQTVNVILNGSASSAAGTVQISGYKFTANNEAPAFTPVQSTLNYSSSATSKAATTSEVTVTTTAATGYRFLGWYDDATGGNLKSSDATYTYTCTDETTLYARYEAIAVTGVSVSPTSATMNIGDTKQLIATITPSNAANQNVTWTSSNASVASVSNTGVVTAHAAGSTTITVTTVDGGKTATCEITVSAAVCDNKPTLTGNITATPGTTVCSGSTVTLSVTGASNGTVVWGTGTQELGTGASYTINNITSTTTYWAKVRSTATGSDPCAGQESEPKTITITVTQAPTLSETTKSMVIGDTYTLTGTNLTDCTWSSSNAAVATVSDGVITAVNAGTATITVTAPDCSSLTATCSVTVTAKPVYILGTYNINGSKVTKWDKDDAETLPYDATNSCYHFTVESGDDFKLSTIKDGEWDSGWNVDWKKFIWKTGNDMVGVTTNGKPTSTDYGNTNLTLKTGFSNPITVYVNVSKQMWAVATSVQYTLTFNANGGTGTVPTGGSYSYGATVTMPAGTGLSKEHYTFVGWNTNANGTGTTYAAGANYAMPAANTTLYAQWTEATHSVSISATEGGTVKNNNNVYTGNQTIGELTQTALVAVPNDYYKFTGWDKSSDVVFATGDASSTDISITANADGTLQANFAEIMHEVSCEAGSGGQIEPSVSSVGNAVEQTITAVAQNGYRFTNWTVEEGSGVTFGDPNRATTTIRTTGDAKIKANFVKIWEVTINYKYGENGILTSATLTVDDNTEAEFTAETINDYEFDSWTLPNANFSLTNGNASSKTIKAKVTADVEISANYGLKTTWELRMGPNWSSAAAYFCTDSTGSGSMVYAKLRLNGGYYEFKLKNEETWYGNSGHMIADNCTNWPFTSSENTNCHLYAIADGYYTFALNTTNQQVSVSYPEGGKKIYFNNTGLDWKNENRYVYYYKESNGDWKVKDFPGVPMGGDNSCGFRTVYIYDGWKININNGIASDQDNGRQTNDYSYGSLTNNGIYYAQFSNKAWENNANSPETFTLEQYVLSLTSSIEEPAQNQTITLTADGVDNILSKNCISLDFSVKVPNASEYVTTGFTGTGKTRSYTILSQGEYDFKVELKYNDEPISEATKKVEVEMNEKTFHFFNTGNWNNVYLSQWSPTDTVFTVVGDAELLGIGWNLNCAMNEMHKTSAEGDMPVHELKRRHVLLEKKTYKCKVVGNHSYNFWQAPSGDWLLKMNERWDNIIDETTLTNEEKQTCKAKDKAYFDVHFIYTSDKQDAINHNMDYGRLLQVQVTLSDDQAAETATTSDGGTKLTAGDCSLYTVNILHGHTFHLSDATGKEAVCTRDTVFREITHNSIYTFSKNSRHLTPIQLNVQPENAVINNIITLSADAPATCSNITYEFFYRRSEGANWETAQAASSALSCNFTPTISTGTGTYYFKMTVYRGNVELYSDYGSANVQNSTEITFFFHNKAYDGSTPAWENVGLYVWFEEGGKVKWENKTYPGVKLIPQIGDEVYEITVPRDAKFVLNNYINDNTDDESTNRKHQTVYIEKAIQDKIDGQTSSAPNLEDHKVYCLEANSKQWQSGSDAGTRYTLAEESNAQKLYRVKTTNSKGVFYSNWVQSSPSNPATQGDTLSFFVEHGAKIEVFENGSLTAASIINSYDGDTGVKTALLSNDGQHNVVDIKPYDRNLGYFINIDAAKGQRGYQMNWIEMSEEERADAKFTYFEPNENYPNEYYNHYWVRFIKSDTCVNATVGNRYHGCLSNAIIPQTPMTTADGRPAGGEGANVRFGYNDKDNDFSRVFLAGSTATNEFLKIYGTGLYKNATGDDKLDKEHARKFNDGSNWVYECEGYAVAGAEAVIEGKYPYSGANSQSNYLFKVDEDNKPITKSVLSSNSTTDVRRHMRFIYDYKTNRLITAWMPEGEINTHEVIGSAMIIDRIIGDKSGSTWGDDNVTQIKATADGSVEGITQIYSVLEVKPDNWNKFTEGNESVGFVWFSLPYDCYVKDIYGIPGYGTKWVIQRHRGDKRAEQGWQSYIDDFWYNMKQNETAMMEKGRGYVVRFKLSQSDFEKIKLEVSQEEYENWNGKKGTDNNNGETTYWIEKSNLRLYFPSKEGEYKLDLTSAADLTVVVPEHTCTIPGREKEDSHWNVIGVPAYQNINLTSVTSDMNTDNTLKAPRFIYQWAWDSGNRTYTINSTEETSFTFGAMNAYMAQFYGTINWANYTQTKPVAPAAIQAKRVLRTDNGITYAANPGGTLRLELLNDTVQADRTYIRFAEDHTYGFDFNYDTNKIPKSGCSYLYSFDALNAESISGNTQYAANCLPVESTTIPLGVTIAAHTDYTFRIENIPEGITAILHDSVEGLRVDLSMDDYTVALNQGTYTNRFYLEVEISDILVEEPEPDPCDPTDPEGDCYVEPEPNPDPEPDTQLDAVTTNFTYWQSGNSLYISGLNAGDYFALYDMVGHLIYESNFRLGEPIPAPQTGIYLLCTSNNRVKINIR